MIFVLSSSEAAGEGEKKIDCKASIDLDDLARLLLAAQWCCCGHATIDLLRAFFRRSGSRLSEARAVEATDLEALRSWQDDPQATAHIMGDSPLVFPVHAELNGRVSLYGVQDLRIDSIRKHNESASNTAEAYPARPDPAAHGTTARGGD